jgi:hypothetical protein
VLSLTERLKRFTTAQERRIYLRWKYALLKIAALISFLSFCLYPLTGGVRGEEATVAPYLFSVPSLLVFLLPRRFLSVARGIALGQSALICWAGGQALVIGLVLRQPDKTLELILVGFVVQLFFGLAALLIDDPLKKAKSELAQMFLGAAATLIFISASYERFQTNYTKMDPELVYPVIACLETYKAGHDGQYADSLQSLVRAQGVNCIYPFSEKGSSPFGKIKYQARHAGDGHVSEYSIILGGTTFWGRFSADAYTDQTGILHLSQDHQNATPADPVPPNITTFLHEWSQCLSKHAKTHPDTPFPVDLSSMMEPGWSCKPRWYVKDNYLAPSQFHRVDYYSDTGDGTKPRAAFHLLGRPNQYGSSGVRHYYVDESGVIRGTPANRDATRYDPPIPECEWVEHKACSSD